MSGAWCGRASGTSDRGTVISAASQRASVWLLTRYSRGVRVRLCKGGRVEARWMLGDGAARGATPSALAKSTPSFLFSLPTRILFLPWDALLLLLPSFFFPLSLFASFVLLRFSTSFCLFPLSSSFFFYDCSASPLVSLSILRSDVAHPFFFRASIMF